MNEHVHPAFRDALDSMVNASHLFNVVPFDVVAPQAPRVLARITEDPGDRIAYQWRCEGCGSHDDSAYLHLVADEAHEHAVLTGHAVLVEAL